MLITEIVQSSIRYHTALPSAIKSKIQAMAEFVAQGGEVSYDSALSGLQRAAIIGWAESDDQLVAIRALKNPLSAYRSKVFDASGSHYDSMNYAYELGYSYVDPSFRNQGISMQLGKTVMSKTSKGVFSTTRSDNIAAIKGLKNMGFKEAGDAYPSARGNYTLQLWVNG